MAFTIPDAVSIRGDATQVRHIYLPGLAQSFVVWTANLYGDGFYFVKRPSTAINFASVPHDDVNMAGPFFPDTFDVFETATANVVYVVFAVGNDIWSFTYDFANDVVVSSPAIQFSGSVPSLADEDVGDLLVSYLREGELRARKTLAGDELTVTAPSSADLIDQDTHSKDSASFVIRYLGLHGIKASVARPFQTDGNTQAMYSSALTTGTDLLDLSGNGLDLTLGGNLAYDVGGVQFDGSFTPSIATLPVGAGNTFEAWVTPKFSRRESFVVSGDMFFGWLNNGEVFFGFDDGGSEVRFVQTAGRTLDHGQLSHVVASHTFGIGANTFIAVNGSEVVGRWVKGTGDENPAPASFTASIDLGPGDLLHQWRAASVAKTLVEVQNYTKGKV